MNKRMLRTLRSLVGRLVTTMFVYQLKFDLQIGCFKLLLDLSSGIGNSIVITVNFIPFALFFFFFLGEEKTRHGKKRSSW